MLGLIGFALRVWKSLYRTPAASPFAPLPFKLPITLSRVTLIGAGLDELYELVVLEGFDEPNHDPELVDLAGEELLLDGLIEIDRPELKLLLDRPPKLLDRLLELRLPLEWLLPLFASAIDVINIIAIHTDTRKVLNFFIFKSLFVKKEITLYTNCEKCQ